MLAKHADIIHKKFFAFSAEYNKLFRQFLNLDISELTVAMQEAAAKEKQSFKYPFAKYQKSCVEFTECFKTYSLNFNYEFLKDALKLLKQVEKNILKCSNILIKSGKYFPKDVFFSDFANREFYLIKKDNMSLAKPLYEQITSLMQADYMILKANSKGKKVRNFFHSLKRSRAQKTLSIGNFKINIVLKSSVNLARAKLELTNNKFVLLTDILKAKSDKYLRAPQISDDIENHLIHVKSLLDTKNNTALEQELLDYFLQVLSNFLEENTNLLRAPYVNLYIELFHSNEYSGWMQEEISSFSNIFMKIAFDEPLIDAYLMNKNVDKTTEFYGSLLHEFTHSYDWILNSKKDYMIAKQILLSEPVQSTVVLTRVLKSLRMEGLAGLSTLFNQGIEKEGQVLLNLNSLLQDFDDYSKELNSFFVDMYEKDAVSLKKLEKSIYESGAVQYIGFWMALLIFIKEVGPNAKYYFSESKSAKSILKKMNENFNHSKLTEKTEGVWLNWNEVGSALLDAARNPKTKSVSMFIDKKILLEYANSFVKRFGIIPPNLFIEKYIDSAQSLSIGYGKITKNCMQELNAAKLNEFAKF
jgi:hypothetical protein